MEKGKIDPTQLREMEGAIAYAISIGLLGLKTKGLLPDYLKNRVKSKFSTSLKNYTKGGKTPKEEYIDFSLGNLKTNEKGFRLATKEMIDE